MNNIPIITIDGPSGTGKGTMASLIAKELGWHLLDSGAMYRQHAYAALQEGIPLDDEAQLTALALRLDCSVTGDAIRTEAIGKAASQASAFASVRAALLERQKACVQPPGLVADGRDMGSVVFPQAAVKFYLDASCQERAQRRHKQLQERGIDVKLPDLLEEIMARDYQDKTRAVSPLVVPSGAVVLNTDNLNIDEVFRRMMEVIRRRLGKV